MNLSNMRWAVLTAWGCALACAAQDEPKVEDVLKKVDDALFFWDRQEKLQGYDVELARWENMVGHGKAAEPKPDKTAKPDKIVYDAATGKKKQTDAGGTEVAPGSFRPSCGPWTLAAVAAFEIELFAQPFSTRFDAAAYDREAQKTDAGWLLKLTAKQPIGEENFLKPAILGLDLEIGQDGVPTSGTLHLSMKINKDDAPLAFRFADVTVGKAKKKRIERIENTLTSANLKVTPSLTFAFDDKAVPILPKTVEFRVAGAELSGTLRGMDSVTFAVFQNLKARMDK